MNAAREQAVIERQRRLAERSAELRIAIGYEARPLAAPLALADRAIAVGKGARDWASANPLWIAGAVVAVVVAKPRRAWRWARRGWSAWRMLRLAQSFVASRR